MYNLKRMFGDISKVKLMSESEIDDPWYTRDFERAYIETFNACKKIIETIKE